MFFFRFRLKNKDFRSSPYLGRLPIRRYQYQIWRQTLMSTSVQTGITYIKNGCHIRAQLVEIYLYTCFGTICYPSPNTSNTPPGESLLKVRPIDVGTWPPTGVWWSRAAPPLSSLHQLQMATDTAGLLPRSTIVPGAWSGPVSSAAGWGGRRAPRRAGDSGGARGGGETARHTRTPYVSGARQTWRPSLGTADRWGAELDLWRTPGVFDLSKSPVPLSLVDLVMSESPRPSADALASHVSRVAVSRLIMIAISNGATEPVFRTV